MARKRLPDLAATSGPSESRSPDKSVAGRQAEPAAQAPPATLAEGGVVPLYYQLEAILQHRIDSGLWPSGTRLPTERELCLEFHVSRSVVRPALDILESGGKIERVQGRGTFVAAPKRVARLAGIAGLFGSRSAATAVTILEAAERKLDADLAGVLELPVGGPAMYVSALIGIADTPVCLCSSVIATDRVPWLTDALKEGPWPPDDGGPRKDRGTCRGTIETWGSLNEFEAFHLKRPIATPHFVVHIVHSHPVRNREAPIEDAWLVYPADTVMIQVSS
jgi:DNA-binding transcriptional regulator YhcF (GntR family)